MYKRTLLLLSFLSILTACNKKVKEQEDKIYSRHLQRHVALTIISTPGNTKQDYHLLLLNDGQDMKQLRVRSILDSLYEKGLIKPVLVAGIHAGDRMKEYGVAGTEDFEGRGDKADKYAQFVINELYPFAKKRAGIRKFNSVVIAGSSLGGLSAFDIAWDHADKIDKVGVFSGSFWWRDLDSKDSAYSDDRNRIMINKIRSSRKQPHLKYWFYSGGKEETSDRDGDGIIDVVDDTKDLADLIKAKKVCPPGDIHCFEEKEGLHDYASWSKHFPAFLTWAFKK